MTEVIVISDDDLEEGEILDEVDIIEPVIEIKPKTRGKKLPRRYVLHENKDLSSKHHRKSSHHRKRHKCPHHLERSKLGSNNSSSSNAGSSHSHHRENAVSSTLSSLKSAFKNYSSPRREPVKKHRSPQKPVSKGNTLPEISASTPTHKELKKEEGTKINSDVSKEDSLLKHESSSLHIRKPEPANHSVKLDESYKLVNIEEDEDEDEEELRRIALATYLKVPVSDSALVSEKCTVSKSVNNNLCSSNKPKNQLLGNCDIYLPGNNEVVDMDLDSDCSTEDVESRLFVIDKNPLNSNAHHDVSEQKVDKSPIEPFTKAKSPSNHEFLLPNSQTLSEDDIEEAALRAQVIASMRSTQQQTKEVPLKPIPPLAVGNTNKVLPIPRNSKVQTVQNRKVVRTIQPYFKSVNFLNMTRKRVVNKAKLNYLKSLNHKKSLLPPQRKINAGPERLIITLNNDSSSDESDEENDQTKGTLEKASIASIEALISDARQKSDVVKNIDSTNVSCLSKAQQEEYNNLKKILAEKEAMQKKTVAEVERKRALQLKVLSREVSTAESNLNKEIDMLTNCEKELFEKKQEYITSKLKVQLLKEQLHAAEVVRAANLEAWKKTAAKLDIQKKSVSKHKAIVDLLQKKLSTKQLPPENSVLSSNKNINHAT